MANSRAPNQPEVNKQAVFPVGHTYTDSNPKSRRGKFVSVVISTDLRDKVRRLRHEHSRDKATLLGGKNQDWGD